MGNHRRRNGQSFQSTLPARGATYVTRAREQTPIVISIHAPRTGSDALLDFCGFFVADISIHAPRTGSDHLPLALGHTDLQFQSTLPARGATRLSPSVAAWEKISIHAPRTGSDGFKRMYNIVNLTFQSTLPARGATCVQRRRG